ncbi:copper-binding protein [Dactylosporangium sp. NPDC005555]|uniref:OmpL47-type beta-barrel domain-containing protein n=1 Tax=Dactylosporangium sp. NPDC005555 TaxID=3154889 RepID=UPI0033B9AE6F
MIIRRALLALALLAAVLVAPPSTAFAADQVLTWTTSGAITGYRTAPTQAVAGAATIVFENSEATGNTTGMPHTLTFDSSTPGYNHDVAVNILANPFDANNGRHEMSVTLTPGRYRYFCIIPGHSLMVGEFVVTGGGPDTTPPTVTASVTGDGTSTATVTVTATDSGSGVASVEYQLDDGSFQPYTAPVRVTAPGDHSVQYRATDAAGNTSATGSVAFSVTDPGPVDTTPPTVTAAVAGTRDGAGNYVGSATVTVSASDAGSGVARVETQTDGGAWVVYSAPVVVGAVGAHMVHYRATDVAGNTSPEGMASFTVVAPPVVDTTPPTVTGVVTGTRDGAGNYVGSATVTVTASDAGSGVARVETQTDGGAWVVYSAPVVVGAVGAHMVHYRATDVAGNTSPEGMASFTVVAPPVEDTTPPTVTAAVTGRQDGSGRYVGAATVAVTATDSQSGVRSIEYTLDGGAWTVYTAPVVVRAAGVHAVSYRATDRASNVAPAQSVAFTVVADGTDACPGSDDRPHVVIGGVDSGVPNVDTGNGCTINDLIAEHAPYPDHAAFVRHVDAVTGPLVTAGVLTRRDQGAIVRAATRSTVPHTARGES